MILKALYDYYERKGDLPRKGMELKEIGFLIVIDKEGNFVRIENRMTNQKQGSRFLVVKSIIRSGKKYEPNCFWDNYEYIIGGNGESEKKNKTFIDLLYAYKKDLPNNMYVNAISNFYLRHKNIKNVIVKDPLQQVLSKSKKNISFLIEGLNYIAAEDKEIVTLALSTEKESLNKPCLVTGKIAVTSRLHSPVKLTKDTGALVSFQKESGYDSYGKTQAYNAPVSEDAEFAYTATLNHLLRFGSQNKFIIGDRTFVFWASKDDEAGKQAEESIWDMLGFKDNDDPDKNIINVRKAFESIYSGSIKTALDDRFYILGLAPNSTRIAVTYWADIPLKDFSEMILRHFKDMEIVDTRKEKKPYFGLHSLLATVSLKGKSSNVSPNLPDAVVKSIFQGLPYPQTLFASCIRRIRAEQSISITRAAILKAYLNRLNDNNNNKLTVMLDTSNTNQGYLCGRLFAVLDKIQDDANNQRSIKERYINSASATPAAVFSTILNLSLHHSAKLNEGRSVYFEKIKQEIVDKISADGFPAHLDLQDQGRFFVGYYHQMQWFYTKNSDKEVDNND